MKNQVYHIQKLLVDELDNCKGKGNNYIKGYIRCVQAEKHNNKGTRY